MATRHPILEQHLRERYGMDPDVLGPAMIESAVARRLRALGLISASQYAVRVIADPAESSELVEELVVPETWFYRYPKSFELLTQHAEAWLAKNGQGNGVFKVLSAPCSTGEEAWSSAICLLEAGLKPAQIRIDAVDISVQSIALAKLASYGTHSFRGESIPNKERYINLRGKLFVVNDALKKLVHFRQANLLTMGAPPPAERYDVVFSRNVMIYLAAVSRKQLAGLIAMSVKPSGLVFSGHSENFALLDGRFRPAGQSQSFGYRFDPDYARDPSPMPAPMPTVGPPGKSVFGYKTGAYRALAGSGVFPALDDGKGSAAASVSKSGPASPARPAAPAAASALPAPAGPVTPPGGPTVAQARQLADAGRLADALLVCEATLQRSGPDVEAYVLLGVVHEALGDHERAQRAYEKALYLDHRHYEALVHLGLLAQRRGDATGALNYNRRASEAISGVREQGKRRGGAGV